MSVAACPACASTALKLYPVSRRTQRETFRCLQCGMVGWTDRVTIDLDDDGDQLTVGLDQVSVEERAEWFRTKKDETGGDAWQEALDRVTTLVGDPAGRRWYDIGAGDGTFLSHARKRGYQVRGNDLFAAAPIIAERRYGITLDLGDLRDLDLPEQDVISLWCVIAHTPDPNAILRSCFDQLRPGGVLYLQTPHRSFMDRMALRGLRATGGRVSHWTDRRIAGHHWFLHTPESMRQTLTRLGYVDVRVEPEVLYTRSSAEYLASMGVGGKLGSTLGKGVDQAVARGMAPRIVLMASARKPGALGPADQVAETPAAEDGVSA